MAELVGRGRELAEVETRLAGVRAGSGAVVLVEGEAGAGKTAFANAVTRRARAAGHATAWGACPEGEPGAPFRPWLQILQSIRAPATGLDEPADASVTRYRRFDAVVEALRDRATGDGLLLVLDDLHAADLGSLRLLQHVASEAADLPLMLLALFREGQAGTDRHDVLSAVGRERGAHRIRLGALAADDVTELATRAAAGPLDAATLRAIGERSGGNPLFVVELARLAGTGERLPRGIRATIGRRLDAVPADTRLLLRQASVHGREFDAVTLAATVRLTRDEAVARLGPALDAGVLVADGPVLRFDHVLTQEVLYAELGPTERQELHARAASAVADGPIETVAHHLRQGGEAEALTVTLRAAERARGRLAYEDAAYQYRAALDLLPRADDGTRARLLLDLAGCEFRAGAVDAAWRCCHEAADLGRAAGDAAVLADAATVLRGVTDSSVTPRIHALCRSALPLLGDTEPVRRARVLAQLVVTADPFGPGPEVTHDGGEPDLGRRALQQAEASGDPDAVFLALQARGTELTGAGHVLERLSLGERAVRLGREVGRPEYAAWGHLWRLGAFAELGRRVPFDAELAAFAVAVDQLREPLWTWRLTLVRTSVALSEGRLARAAELMAEGQVRGRRAGHEAADFFHLVYADALAQLTGEGYDPVERAVRAFTEQGPFLSRAWHVNVLMHMSRIDEVRAMWPSLVPHLGAFPRHAREWVVAMSGMADVCVALGDRETGAWAYAQLLTFADRQVIADPLAPGYGPVALWLGRLARLLGDAEAAGEHLRSALATSLALGFAPATGYVHLELARAALDQGDRAAAREHLDAAGDLARRLGLAPLQVAVEAVVTPPPAAGPLTPREEQIAALVAEGLSNRQIAERLYLSVRTVENHVTHILVKLGFESRARIASWHADPSRRPQASA
ncbi:helix-turn-helix transcriptional regulator [Microbispora rosea]|uniref:helix-turn-helix transcriptional regulator n=1 Tax=Microbispora rosea TaxID=58117 RepID=UPI00342413D0